jgi:hypothetical protein
MRKIGVTEIHSSTHYKLQNLHHLDHLLLNGAMVAWEVAWVCCVGNSSARRRHSSRYLKSTYRKRTYIQVRQSRSYILSLLPV